MESQPKIFDVAFLREIERQQKERQRYEQDGSDQARKALKEIVNGPKFQGVAEVFPIAQAQCAAGEEGGVGSVSHRDVNAAHHQNERGFSGRQVEVVDAGDLLVASGLVSVRTLGPNAVAVGKNIKVEGLRTEGRVLRDRQFDEQG